MPETSIVPLLIIERYNLVYDLVLSSAIPLGLLSVLCIYIYPSFLNVFCLALSVKDIVAFFISMRPLKFEIATSLSIKDTSFKIILYPFEIFESDLIA